MFVNLTVSRFGASRPQEHGARSPGLLASRSSRRDGSVSIMARYAANGGLCVASIPTASLAYNELHPSAAAMTAATAPITVVRPLVEPSQIICGIEFQLASVPPFLAVHVLPHVQHVEQAHQVDGLAGTGDGHSIYRLIDTIIDWTSARHRAREPDECIIQD